MGAGSILVSLVGVDIGTRWPWIGGKGCEASGGSTDGVSSEAESRPMLDGSGSLKGEGGELVTLSCCGNFESGFHSRDSGGIARRSRSVRLSK